MFVLTIAVSVFVLLLISMLLYIESNWSHIYFLLERTIVVSFEI